MSENEKKEVTLTELQYFKLLRYIEAAISLEAQSELLLQQAKTKVKAAHELRDNFFQELSSHYPDLDPNGNYQPRESDFTLVPV